VKTKVAVVILNWNGRKFLEQFLPSVIKHNPSFSQVYLADNASSDDSVIYTQTNFPQITVIQNDRNGGFAQGYNEALQKVDAEYYVLLNSDVRVTANWIEPLIELMDKNDRIAACQPKILAFNHPDSFEYAGAAGGFVDKWGYPFCRGRIFDTLEKDEQQYDDNKEIFWASGACLFIRADLYHRMSGFDADFFAHMEEIDLCWRLKNAGYQISYDARSTVYHVGGGTLEYLNPRKTYLNFRNNLFMLYKNLPSKQLFYKIFIRMILDGLAGFKFLINKDFSHVGEILKAHRDFYLSLKKLIYKRQQLQKIKLTEAKLYPRTLIFEYFVKKRKKFSQLP